MIDVDGYLAQSVSPEVVMLFSRPQRHSQVMFVSTPTTMPAKTLFEHMVVGPERPTCVRIDLERQPQ